MSRRTLYVKYETVFTIYCEINFQSLEKPRFMWLNVRGIFEFNRFWRDLWEDCMQKVK